MGGMELSEGGMQAKRDGTRERTRQLGRGAFLGFGCGPGVAFSEKTGKYGFRE